MNENKKTEQPQKNVDARGSALIVLVSLFPALPSWILANVATTFLPAKHPWKKKRFSLVDWAENRTDLCEICDFTFWVTFPMSVTAIVMTFFKG